jgi:hypothetical protein
MTTGRCGIARIKPAPLSPNLPTSPSKFLIAEKVLGDEPRHCMPMSSAMICSRTRAQRQGGAVTKR